MGHSKDFGFQGIPTSPPQTPDSISVCIRARIMHTSYYYERSSDLHTMHRVVCILEYYELAS
jgi:hypothetical protein